MNRLGILCEQLATVIPQLHHAAFPDQLVALLKALVRIDDATILIYPGNNLPQLAHAEEPAATGSSTLNKFLRGAFLLDPYYQAARDGKFGVFQLQELAPAGFRDGEYYRSWYRNCGYQDEVGYLIATADGGFINIALGKIGAGACFSAAEVATLREIQPAVEALCQRHWDAPVVGAESSMHLRTQLHNALENFGSSVLTEREAQVINLVLHGHSTRTLAEQLSISMETVKLHRKHAYAKLQISSQAELFYLFIDSVMSARNYAGGDTLRDYLRGGPE